MDYEKIINLKENSDFDILKRGKSITYNIPDKSIKKDALYRLFFSCEDASAPTLKNESGAELLYMLIDDSLSYDEADENRFCLDFSCKNPLPYPKRAIKKIMWQPLIYGLYKYENFTHYENKWTYGIKAKAENLKIEKEGYLRFILDVWKVREGVNPHDTTSVPFERHIINIDEGSYNYKTFEKEIELLKEETACVIVSLEGENFFGNVYFECPFLKDKDKRNLLPEFDTGNIGLKDFAWLGQNLSKREWPHFIIELNGEKFFDGEAFLKVHRFSPIEIPIPKGLMKERKNVITITYSSDYPHTIPLLIDECKLLEQEKCEFEILNCPKEAVTGEPLKLLIETEFADLTPDIKSENFEVAEITKFEEFNLQVIELKALKEENNLTFSIKYKNEEKTYSTERFVKKSKDNIIAGSGDMIYIDVSKEIDVIDFIKWYVKNDIGKLVTIRPVYRWGGQRYVNTKVWEKFIQICRKLDLYYVHISDGRDIGGLTANPSEKMLIGENFLGRQLHERDGQLFYWSPSVGHPREISAPLEEFFDLAARLGREYPETIEGSYRPFNIEWSDFGYSYRRERCKTIDMKELHSIVLNELKNLAKDNFSRHTGPAVVFKYFYEAGFNWTGAETMDGATEVLLAFLRGASKAYKKEKTGVHLALQWSTFPHDTIQRYRRYLLSLYIPYMHGMTDINTEEGLWFIEARYAYHNRISDVCENHRKQLRRFNKFIRTHSRTGKFYTPVAFLHGRYDGWNGFNNQNTWGMPFIKPWDDAESWTILKSFYPLNTLSKNGCYKTGCILPDNTEPFGLFSGTPRGNADVIPIETGDLGEYPLLIFAGYNCAEKADLNKISSYVKEGGTLVGTWAHFSDTTLREDIESYNLNIIDHEITRALSTGECEFENAVARGKEIKICKNHTGNCEIIKKTDNGEALILSVPYGKGKIYLVNTILYPGNESIMPIYRELTEKLTDELLKKESCRVECGTDVGYTTFKQDDGSMHYYFTAVDWYNNSESNRKARLYAGGYSYEIDIPFGTIVKVIYKNGYLVWPENDFAEIIDVCAGYFTAQGYGKETFFAVKNGEIKKYTDDFEKEAVKTIAF